MLEKHRTVCGVVLDGHVDIRLRVFIFFLLEQYPCIGVKVCAVVGFGLHRAIAHLLGLVEILARFRQIVGIVVQTAEVVVLPLQTTVISGIGFLLLPLAVKDVAHDGIKV